MFYIGPEKVNVFASLSVLNLVAATVFYFNCYLYWFIEKQEFKFMVICGVLWASSLVSFVSTAFREPGLIPKQYDDDLKPKDSASYANDPINFDNG